MNDRDVGLKKKVAIIGGSSRGLGRGCAIQLAREGVNVVLCANRDKASLEETSKHIKDLKVEVLAFQGDMSSKEDNERLVDETIKKFGKVDILINNSGGPPAGTFFDFEEKDWEQAFRGVLLYVIRMCKLTIPYMKKQGWGRIINITSLVVKEPSEGLILSSVFRTGVVSMAKVLSRELIKHNITINSICPGSFQTDRAVELMQREARQKNVSLKEIEKNAVARMPLGRYQQPSELGDLVTFLCSDLACGITGTTIQIDGGVSRSLF